MLKKNPFATSHIVSWLDHPSLGTLTGMACELSGYPIGFIYLQTSHGITIISGKGVVCQSIPSHDPMVRLLIRNGAFAWQLGQNPNLNEAALVKSGPQLQVFVAQTFSDQDTEVQGGLIVGGASQPKVLSATQTAQLAAFTSNILKVVCGLHCRTAYLELSQEVGNLQQVLALCEFEPDGTIRTANEHFAQALGYHANEMVGMHHDHLLPYYLRNSNYSQGVPPWQHLTSGKQQNKERKYLTKDYREVYLEVYFFNCYSQDHSINKVIGLAFDITQQKWQSSKLEQEMAALYASSAVMELDLEGQILAANDNFLSIVGYDRDELVGQNHAILVPENQRGFEDYREQWRQLRVGKPIQGQFERVSKTGKPLYLFGSYNPLLDLNGDPFRVIKIAYDLTEQRRDNETKSQILSAIDRSTPQIEFNPKGYILSANKKFLELVKYSRSEIVGKHHSIFLDPEQYQSQDYKNFWITLAGGKFLTGEYKRYDKFGDEIWLQGSYNPIFNVHGKPYKIIKYALDITSAKIAEQKLEQERTKTLHTAKLASLGEMAAGIAHEINNPLAIVSGIVRSLPKHRDSAKFQQKLSQAQDAVGRMATIVRNLKRFTGQQTKVAKEPCLLREVVTNSLVLLRPLAQHDQVHIDFHWEDPGTILANEIEIEQVVINLVKNAIEACKNSPQPRVDIACFADQSEVVLTVIDNGDGIAPEDAAKIFQPFFTRKPTGEGTGLGLAIAIGILRDHEAVITVKSTKPTCFEVRFKHYSLEEDVA